MPNLTKRQYPYLWLWNRFLGGTEAHYERLVERAKATRAPAHAIYELPDQHGHPTGHWAVVEEVTASTTRTILAQMCQEYGIPVPKWKDLAPDSQR